MLYRIMKLGALLLVAVSSTQSCFGSLLHEFGQVYKYHEKWVFVLKAKQLAVKYSDIEVDPDSETFPEILIDPNFIYDKKIEELQKSLNESIDRIRDNKNISFNDAVNKILFCSPRMMNTLILIVDQVWPEERKEIRRLVDQEIKRRGPEGDMYASLNRVYLFSDGDSLFQREQTLYEIIKDKNTTK